MYFKRECIFLLYTSNFTYLFIHSKYAFYHNKRDEKEKYTTGIPFSSW